MSVVEYSITLRDMASAKMRQFSTTVNRSNGIVNSASRNMLRRFVSVQRSIEANSRSTRDMSRDIANLTHQVDRLTRSLENAASVKANKGSMLDVIGGVKGGGQLAMGAMAMAAAQQVVSGVVDYSRDAMRNALERQMTTATYTVLAGGEKQGSALVDRLVALQRDTMLGGEVFDAAKTMMAFGVGGDVVGRIEQLGNVAMGDAERLQSLVLAMSQMTAAGKLQGQDRLQLVNAGWNPLVTLSEMTGKSVSELNEAMSKGMVTSDMVWRALDRATSAGGQFAGVLDEIGKTDYGRDALLSGMAEETSIAYGEALMPLRRGWMELMVEYVLPLVNKVLPVMKRWMEQISGAFAPLGAAMSRLKEDSGGVGALMHSWKDHMGSVVGVWTSLMRLLSSVAGLMLDIVRDSGVWGLLSRGLLKVMEGVNRVIAAMVNSVTWVVENVIRPVVEWLLGVWNGLKEFLGFRGRSSKPVRTGGDGDSSMPGIVPGGTGGVNEAESLALLQRENAATAGLAGGGVSGGGPRVVNVTVGKLLDRIELHTTTLQEGVDEIERVVLDTLARVLAQGASVSI